MIISGLSYNYFSFPKHRRIKTHFLTYKKIKSCWSFLYVSELFFSSYVFSEKVPSFFKMLLRYFRSDQNFVSESFCHLLTLHKFSLGTFSKIHTANNRLSARLPGIWVSTCLNQLLIRTWVLMKNVSPNTRLLFRAGTWLSPGRLIGQLRYFDKGIWITMSLSSLVLQFFSAVVNLGLR